jgi:hypothetical protein
MFGKDATETMWITESQTNVFYKTKAQSHGCDYYSEMKIIEGTEQCELVMDFTGVPQSLFAKIMAKLMSQFMTEQLRKTMQADLKDIKSSVLEIHSLKTE